MKSKSNLPEDAFARRLGKLSSNRPTVNNTPIRVRNRERDGNKENSSSQNQSRDYLERDSVSPYNENSTNNSKTIPKRKVSVVNRTTCVNHGEVEAEFKIQIDGENLNYCNKCAAHLASNGFQVERMLPSRSPRRTKDLPRSPAVNQRRQELNLFIQSLQEVENGYLEKEEHLQKLQESHEIEKETITNFYSSMFEYLEYMRDEHLNFLDDESKRTNQICEIEADQIGETFEELKTIRQDIETNVDKIVQTVDEDSYLQCMTYYNQQKGVHQHRLTELGSDARPANCTTSEFVEEKLSQFKYFIDELTGILSSKAESLNY